MSKFVDEILLDLKTNPETFKDVNGHGVKKDIIVVKGVGNSAILSLVYVFIRGVITPTTYMDKYRLEKAIREWYKIMPLEVLQRD